MHRNVTAMRAVEGRSCDGGELRAILVARRYPLVLVAPLGPVVKASLSPAPRFWSPLGLHMCEITMSSISGG